MWHRVGRRVFLSCRLFALAAATVGAAAFADSTAWSDPYDLSGKFMPGVNLAGAGFGQLKRPDGSPAVHGEDYVYPVPRYSPGYNPGYFLDRGMRVFRLSFLWERLEPALGQSFDEKEFSRLKETVADLTGRGAWVILDLHNYARYNGVRIGEGGFGSRQLASTWSRLATAFRGNEKVLLGLMNEPYDVSTAVWVDAANAAIAAIRETGSRHTILVAGNGYSTAQRWYETQPGGSNANALLAIRDPLNRVVYEAHTYLDPSSGGSGSDCVSTQIGVERLAPFTRWLREHKKKGFLGEFGAGSSPVCLAALGNMARYLDANRDVYLGWAYWAAGPKWPSDWMFLIEPREGKDAPQMSALIPHRGM
jgi:endoglucanase